MTVKIENIANAIANRRRSIGITQAELARRSGVGLCTICNIEQLLGYPRLDTACLIAQGLGVPLSVLIKEAEDDGNA